MGCNKKNLDFDIPLMGGPYSGIKYLRSGIFFIRDREFQSTILLSDLNAEKKRSN